MTKTITLLTIFTVWINISGQQSDEIISDLNYKGKYLGLNFPDTVPEIFAPNSFLEKEDCIVSLLFLWTIKKFTG